MDPLSDPLQQYTNGTAADGTAAGDDAIPAHFGSGGAGGGGGAGPCSYSILDHFNEGCSVLLTGASGYIGSLILEKLLRSTRVGHVYLLLRPRRGASPAERVAKLLQGPLFHLLDPAEAGARVTAVAGDIVEDRLGLSAEDEAMLAGAVDTVIHSAADIRLDAPIHDTLRANYRGSGAVARLAARMRRLRSFVYVSTCYVNINQPSGTLVQERVYPITVGGKPVEAEGIAEELLSLPADAAEALAAKYIDLWGFKNTYALGKHLAEKSVVAMQRAHGLPLAIVRPSLVSAVAAEPYPGYSGNFAGQVGGAVAYLVGLYNDQPEAVASNGDSVWDVVPGDVVAHGTLAVAAAAAVPAVRERVVAPLRAPGEAGRADEPPMVVHVNSSRTYPLTMADMFNDGVVWCNAHRRPFTLALGRSRAMARAQRYDAALWARHMRSAANKVAAIVWLLRLIGGRRQLRIAKMLDAGQRTYETINVLKYDLNLRFEAGTLSRVEECLVPAERAEFRLVWRPPPGAVAAAGGKQQPAAAAAAQQQQQAAAAPPPAKWAAKADAGPDGLAERRARVAAAIAASREGGWPLFHYNVLAYLWRMIYGRDAPAEAAVPAARLKRLVPHLGPYAAATAPRVWHTFFSLA